MSDDRLIRIEEKLDHVALTQVEIKSDLAYHIRRTDLLEEKLGILTNVMGAGKVFLWIGSIAGAALALFKLLQIIQS